MGAMIQYIAMGYIELIKQGVARANRNWPLLIVQFVGGIITVFGAFVLIGVPVIIGVIMVGLDVSQMTEVERFFGNMDLHDVMSRYLGVIIILVVGILLYIVFAICLSAFLQAGTAASIGRSALKGSHEFKLKLFFKDAKRFFRPMLLYNILLFFITCMILALAVVAFVAMSSAGIIAFGSGLAAGDGRMGVFFQWLIILTTIFLFAIVVASFLGLSMQGMAPLVMRGQGPLKSLRSAMKFWDRDRRSIWVLAMVVGGILLIMLLTKLIGAAIQMIPLVGPIINIPYEFLVGVLRMYLWIVALSIVFYYYALKNARRNPATTSPSGGGSIVRGRTSPSQGGGPRPLPPPIPPQE